MPLLQSPTKTVPAALAAGRRLQHIFTNVGDYEATLTFKKKGEPTVHTITFGFTIGDRKQLEIP